MPKRTAKQPRRQAKQPSHQNNPGRKCSASQTTSQSTITPGAKRRKTAARPLTTDDLPTLIKEVCDNLRHVKTKGTPTKQTRSERDVPRGKLANSKAVRRTPHVTKTEPAPVAQPPVSKGKLLKSPPAGSPRGPETVGLMKKTRPLMVSPWLKSRTVYV